MDPTETARADRVRQRQNEYSSVRQKQREYSAKRRKDVKAEKERLLAETRLTEERLTELATTVSMQAAALAGVTESKSGKAKKAAISASELVIMPRFFSETLADRPGVRECMFEVTTPYGDIDALSKCVSEVYCTATYTQPNANAVGFGAGRRMLHPRSATKWALADELKPIRDYQDWLEKEFAGTHCTMRTKPDRGHGAGPIVLDTGDTELYQQDGEWSTAARNPVHRDWDGGRLNSFAVALFLQDDVLGFPYYDEEGVRQEKLVRGPKGTMVLFPTTTYHFGCSHEDYHGLSVPTQVAAHGKLPSATRRRLFMYFDIGAHVKDTRGDVVAETEAPIPKDYDLRCFEVTRPRDAAFIMYSEPMVLKKKVVVTKTSVQLVMGRHYRDYETYSQQALV